MKVSCKSLLAFGGFSMRKGKGAQDHHHLGDVFELRVTPNPKKKSTPLERSLSFSKHYNFLIKKAFSII